MRAESLVLQIHHVADDRSTAQHKGVRSLAVFEGAAAQPPGDVPGLTTNKMNSVNTSPST